MKYENLMSPIKVGNLTIKNRYAVGGMGGRFACFGLKGEYSDNGIEYFTQRARGGFGLIVTGANMADQTVDPFDPLNDTIGPLYAPNVFANGARVVTRRVHAYGAKMFMQVSSGVGRNGNGKAPSPIPFYNNPSVLAEEMTREEIERKINAMIRLSKLAKTWGFDGVEVHGLHWGYLLNQFVMAYTNHRTDEYGGDLDGRMTFIRRVIRGIKEACGEDFPVSVRMCMKSYMAGYNKGTLSGDGEVGHTIEEAVEIAKRLESYGVDMLNVNTGSYDAFYYCVPPYYMPKCNNIPLAKQIKAAVSIPVFCAGGMDDPDICEQAIANGDIDGVTLARASLVDPEYPNKVANNQLEAIRPCIKCTNCIFTNTFLGGGIPLCSSNPAVMQELKYGIPLTAKKKKVAVIGGGVAGMEAARTAKLAGHDVALYEKSGELGGHLIEAGSHPFKSGIAALNKWYQRELKELEIPVYLNTELDAQGVKSLGVDVVILTVGSDHFIPPIPGRDHEKAVLCYDVLLKKAQLGQKVVVVGGGLTGSELAYDLAAYEGKEVTLVEGLDDILSSGPAVPTAVDMMLRELLNINHVTIRTGTFIAAVTDEGALVRDRRTGEESTIPADNVIFAVGLRPKKSMMDELYGTGIEVYQAGDGKQVGNIRSAVADAYEIARTL